MEKRGREQMETDSKFTDIDNALKSIDRKMKEGNVLGHNKVSAMAEQFANKNQDATVAEQPKVQRSVIILWQLQREKNRITAAPYCVCYATLWSLLLACFSTFLYMLTWGMHNFIYSVIFTGN